MEEDKIEEDETIRSCDVIKVLVINKIILAVQLIVTYFIFGNSCSVKLPKISSFGETLPMLLKFMGFIMAMVLLTMIIDSKMEIKRINLQTRLYYLLMCSCSFIEVTMLLVGLILYLVKLHCVESDPEPLIALIMFLILSIPFMIGEFIIACLICKLKRSDALDGFINRK